jgi:hypothetical protein
MILFPFVELFLHETLACSKKTASRLLLDWRPSHRSINAAQEPAEMSGESHYCSRQ